MSENSKGGSNYVLGGKTARACDSCVVKRARWFCAADDAFLCQACDTSVHSANQLASRHERFRLETASSSFKVAQLPEVSTWHHGFTRKARTPRRQPPKTTPFATPLPLVPEINNNTEEEENEDEDQQQLLYRVPIFDPDQFCCADDPILNNVVLEDEDELNLDDLLIRDCRDEELAEFAADVEGLLGTNDDNIGVDPDDQECVTDEVSDGKRVKIKAEENDENDDDDDEVQAVIACHFDPALDMELNWDFEQDMMMMKTVASMSDKNNIVGESEISESRVNRKSLLRLNYEAVIADWVTQQGSSSSSSSSPWTDGTRPHDFNIDEFMVACLGGVCDSWGGFGGRAIGVSDAEREARVLRYKEKRRTRLFSKKIRYQVRKLNAEKRPRMKGRFVKRTTTTMTTNFSPSPSSFPNYLLHHK